MYQRTANVWAWIRHAPADHKYRFIRRKVVLVVFELHEVERRNSAVGRVAGDHVHLVRSQRGIGQVERHVAHVAKPQTVSARESGVAILSIDEVVTETSLPLRRMLCGIDRKSTRLNSSHIP